MNSFNGFALTVAIKRCQQEAVKRKRIIVKIRTVVKLTTLRIYCTYFIWYILLFNIHFCTYSWRIHLAADSSASLAPTIKTFTLRRCSLAEKQLQEYISHVFMCIYTHTLTHTHAHTHSVYCYCWHLWIFFVFLRTLLLCGVYRLYVCMRVSECFKL